MAIDLKPILEQHAQWLAETGGCRADLSRADLRRADLSGANLSEANLSGCTGLLDPIDWLAANCESTVDGIIAYKRFGSIYAPPAGWSIVPGAVLSEVVNPLPTTDCACGINVGTLAWCKTNPGNGGHIWKCLIRWPWLVSAVVPYHTDGKFRVGRVELVDVIGTDAAEQWPPKPAGLQS